MSILAVDTACGSCSVALADRQGVILAQAEEREASRQAERLVPMMQELLAQQKLSYNDLTLLVTTVGPGSFTGLRIGMTAIKGVALVTGLPAMGVNTLEVLACHAEQREASSDSEILRYAQNDKPLLVLLNALRGQVYAQKFLPGVIPACEPALIDLAEISGWAEGCTTIAGNCGDIVRSLFSSPLEGEAGRGVGSPTLHHPLVGKNPSPQPSPSRGEGVVILPDTLPHASEAARLAALRLASGAAFTAPEPLYIRKPDAKLPGGQTA